MINIIFLYKYKGQNNDFRKCVLWNIMEIQISIELKAEYIETTHVQV